MVDIEALFDSIWQQTRSLDMAESEFRRMLVDDPELKRDYRLWCEEQQLSERQAFVNYCRHRLEEEERRYHALDSDAEDY